MCSFPDMVESRHCPSLAATACLDYISLYINIIPIVCMKIVRKNGVLLGASPLILSVLSPAWFFS